MDRSRAGLLTVGALVALFFATSAIESLRAALNVAYRVKHRSVAKPISETPGAKTRASSVFAVTSIPASWCLRMRCVIGTKHSLAGLHALVAVLRA